MEELTLAVPGMWADHHVLAVRDLLRQDDAVTSITASALDARRPRRVRRRAHRSAAHRRPARARAGTPAAKPTHAAAPPTDKPAWATAGVRVTTTNAVDLAMSGDHRKY